jgi:hypothetical protein
MEGVSEADVVRNLSRGVGGLCVGQVWCLVASKWHESWEAFVGGKGPRPEAIDNTPLLEEGGKLKRGLLDMQDYMLLHESIWLKLVDWYAGGPAIRRPVIEVGLKRRAVVEVYPMTLRASERRNALREAVVEVSKGALGMELLQRVCLQLYLPPRRCVLWKLGPDGYEQLKLNTALGSIDESVLIMEESLPGKRCFVVLSFLFFTNKVKMVRMNPVLLFGSAPS